MKRQVILNRGRYMMVMCALLLFCGLFGWAFAAAFRFPLFILIFVLAGIIHLKIQMRRGYPRFNNYKLTNNFYPLFWHDLETLSHVFGVNLPDVFVSNDDDAFYFTGDADKSILVIGSSVLNLDRQSLKTLLAFGLRYIRFSFPISEHLVLAFFRPLLLIRHKLECDEIGQTDFHYVCLWFVEGLITPFYRFFLRLATRYRGERRLFRVKDDARLRELLANISRREHLVERRGRYGFKTRNRHYKPVHHKRQGR